MQRTWIVGVMRGRTAILQRTFKKGCVYTGDFAHGLPHGHGTYTWRTGHVYVGGWVNGKQEGVGTKTWKKNENVYDFNWTGV